MHACVCDLVILKFFCKVLSVRANMKGNLFWRETSGTQAIRGLGANYKNYLRKPATQHLETLIHMERLSWEKKKITSTGKKNSGAAPPTGRQEDIGWFPRKIERTPQIIFYFVHYNKVCHQRASKKLPSFFFTLLSLVLVMDLLYSSFDS